jgi:hypothetical protein
VILREATDDDLRPLMALCRKVWTQLGVPFDTSLDRFRSLQAHGFRIAVLYHSPPASGGAADLTAALAAHPLETDRGPGFEIKSFVVDQDRADNVELLDALSLYSCNIALSEGRHVILSRRDKRIPGTVYGRDLLDMETQDHDTCILQIGDAQAIIERIFQRRPEWRTSL